VVAVGVSLSSTAGAAWSTQTVDASDGSGFDSALAFNPVTGLPAITYSAAVGKQNQVRLAEWNGASWAVTIVASGRDVSSSALNLAFDSSGNPGIGYCGSQLGLVFARRSGSTWTSQTVDSRGGCGPVVYAGGTFWIAYVGGTTKSTNLKLAHLVGASWSSEVVDGSGMSYLSLAFAPDGGPSVAYRSGTGTSTLKFAHKTSSAWSIQSVETCTYCGIFAGLAYDPLSGNPTIAHSNGNLTNLRFARWNGSQWTTEIAATGSCTHSSLAYDAAGVPAISFDLATDTSGFHELHIARRTGCSGTCWEDQLIDDEAPLFVQLRTSLAFAPTGMAAISYGVAYPQILKLARETP